MVWEKYFEDESEATKFKKQVKGWSREKKEALINNDIEELKRLSNLKKNP